MSSQKAVPEKGAATGDDSHEHHDHPPIVEVLSVELSEPKPWQRVLAVRLPADEWQQARAKVMVGLRRKVQLPGFRKGKVPKDLVETQFADQLRMDALEWLLPRAWHQALHEVDLDPVSDPEFSDIDFGEDGGDFLFKATVEIKPEVAIKGYEGLKVTWYVEKGPEGGVEHTLESIRESRAEFAEVDRAAADGDRLGVDFRQVETGGVPILGTEVKGHVFELGSPGILEDFSNGVRGMAVGEERQFPVSYPSDFDQESLAGQTRHFHVTLLKLEEKKLPALDDDFAAQVGKFENLEQLREQIDRNIEAEVKQRNRGRLETALVRSLLAVNEFEVPPSMASRYVEHMIADQERRGGSPLPEEEKVDAREKLLPAAEHALKRWFLLEAVAGQEALVVNDEDYEAHLSSLAKAEGGEVDEIRRNVERAQAEGRIREDLLHRKVFAFLESKAKVKEEEIPEQSAVEPG